MAKADNHHKLTRDILLQMAVRVTLVVVAVSVMTYSHIMDILQKQTTDKLIKYIAERAEKESLVFEGVEANHRIFRDAFLESYLNGPAVTDTQFNLYFETKPDQTLRTRPKFFSGYRDSNGIFRAHVGAWVSPKTPIHAPELRKRLLTAFRLLQSFGPAWRNHLNLYTGFPENALAIHWPEVPWALDVGSQFEVGDKEWMYLGFPKNNPKRDQVWTGVYLDGPSDVWMVSCVTPVDHQDRHLLNIGRDIRLSSLFDRVLNDRLKGTYNFIIRSDGRLIVHPEQMQALKQSAGNVNVSEMDDPILKTAGKTLFSMEYNDREHFIIDDRANNVYLAVAPIRGPDWRLVTVYPHKLLQTPAAKAIRYIIILSILSLLIEMLMLYLLIRSKVTNGLAQLADAADVISRGDYQTVAVGRMPLPAGRNDELGHLARVFQAMSESIYNSQQNLEYKVQERSAALTLANHQLDGRNRELETLDRIVTTLNQHIQPQKIYTALLAQGRTLFPMAQRGALFLTGSDDRFRVAAATGFSLDTFAGMSWPREHFRQQSADFGEYWGRGVVSFKVSHTMREKSEPLDLDPYMLAITLTLNERINGFVIWGSEQAFESSQALMLQRFGHHAANAVSMARYMTSLKEKNAAILEAQNQLVIKEKMATLGTLTAGVAHEFNNPNNFIYGSVQALEGETQRFKEILSDMAEDEADEETMTFLMQPFEEMFKYTALIKEGSQRISSLVRDMRHVSQLDEVAWKEADLLVGLRATVRLIRSQHPEMDIRLEADQPMIRHCRPAELNQVYLNLILNACQAVADRRRDEPDCPGRLIIRGERHQNQFKITFQDTGCGMDTTTRDRAFEAFFTTRPPGGGTGLGLYSCWRIMEKHGGRISISSQPGDGATLTLTL